MSATGRALPASLGAGALVVVIALLGLGGALLAGGAAAPPALAKGAAPEIMFSASPEVWAVLFLVPLLVGFLAYLFRLGLDSAAGRPVRVGAGVAIAVVAALFLAVLLPNAAWNGNSTVTVGGASVSGGGDGSSPGSSGSGPVGHGGGPNGSGASGTGGSNSSSNGGSGGQGGGSSSGSGGGGSGGGSGGGGSTGTGGSGSGSSGTGGSGAGGSSGDGTNCSAGGHSSPSATGNSPIGIRNCTGGTGGGSGGSGGTGTSRGNNTTAASKAAEPVRGISVKVPNWMFLPIAVVLSAAIAVLAIPGVLSRLVDRRIHRPAPPSAGVAPQGVVSVFRDARLAIENGERPRDTIVRLYGRILGRVAPSVEELATSTAEEIRRTQFAALHVSATRSEVITRLFEEARYSTHPIDLPVADRFVETLREVEQDLAMAGAPR